MDLAFRRGRRDDDHVGTPADSLKTGNGEDLTNGRERAEGLGSAHHFARQRHTHSCEKTDQSQDEQDLDKTES
jgi:hypothetical protein